MASRFQPSRFSSRVSMPPASPMNGRPVSASTTPSDSPTSSSQLSAGPSAGAQPLAALVEHAAATDPPGARAYSRTPLKRRHGSRPSRYTTQQQVTLSVWRLPWSFCRKLYRGSTITHRSVACRPELDARQRRFQKAQPREERDVVRALHRPVQDLQLVAEGRVGDRPVELVLRPHLPRLVWFARRRARLPGRLGRGRWSPNGVPR